MKNKIKFQTHTAKELLDVFYFHPRKVTVFQSTKQRLSLPQCSEVLPGGTWRKAGEFHGPFTVASLTTNRPGITTGNLVLWVNITVAEEHLETSWDGLNLGVRMTKVKLWTTEHFQVAQRWVPPPVGLLLSKGKHVMQCFQPHCPRVLLQSCPRSTADKQLCWVVGRKQRAVVEFESCSLGTRKWLLCSMSNVNHLQWRAYGIVSVLHNHSVIAAFPGTADCNAGAWDWTLAVVGDVWKGQWIPASPQTPDHR